MSTRSPRAHGRMLHIDHNYRRVMGTPSKYDSVFDFPPDSPEERKLQASQRKRRGSAPLSSSQIQQLQRGDLRSAAASVSGDVNVNVTPGRRGRPRKDPKDTDSSPLLTKQKEKAAEDVLKTPSKQKTVVAEVMETVTTVVKKAAATTKKTTPKQTATPAASSQAQAQPSQPAQLPENALESPDVIPFRNRHTPPASSPPPFPEDAHVTVTYAGRKRKRDKRALRDETPGTPKVTDRRKRAKGDGNDADGGNENVTPAKGRGRGRPPSAKKTTTPGRKAGRPRKTPPRRKSLPATATTVNASKNQTPSKRRQSLPAESKEEEEIHSDDEDVFTIQEILDKKQTARGGVQYLVHWKGFDKAEDHTWEPVENLYCDALITKFEKKNTADVKGKDSGGGGGSTTPGKKRGRPRSVGTPRKGGDVKTTPGRGRPKSSTGAGVRTPLKKTPKKPSGSATPGSGTRGRPRKFQML